MNLFGLFQVSGSALAAERLRAEVATSNLANAETTRTPRVDRIAAEWLCSVVSRSRRSVFCW